MNRRGSQNEHHHLLSAFEVHLPQVAEGNGLLLACATSASRIRLWPVCCHYESFSALEIIDSRLSLVGEVSCWLPADRPAALSGLGVPPETGIDLGAENE